MLKVIMPVMAVAAHSEELANRILAQGKNVLYFNENDVSLLEISTMKKIHINDILEPVIFLMIWTLLSMFRIRDCISNSTAAQMTMYL